MLEAYQNKRKNSKRVFLLAAKRHVRSPTNNLQKSLNKYLSIPRIFVSQTISSRPAFWLGLRISRARATSALHGHSLSATLSLDACDRQSMTAVDCSMLQLCSIAQWIHLAYGWSSTRNRRPSAPPNRRNVCIYQS